MSQPFEDKKTPSWRYSDFVFEVSIIIILNVSLLFLQYNSLDYRVLLSTHGFLGITGSLSIWFANKFVLDQILQSRIDSSKITRYLPFELTIASVIITSFIYIVLYLIFSYLENMDFVLTNFLKGFLITIGLSLLIVMIYIGNQIWKSWWSDGEFLFGTNQSTIDSDNSKDFILIKDSKGTVNVDLHEVLYFISESKIAFLVDTSGKKRMTQYNLSELESMLGARFFRLNRRILVSRQVISQIKKLPNHRLMVSIGQVDEQHKEAISRYKSTRFKQWYKSA